MSLHISSLFNVAIWICLVGLLAMVGGMQYKIYRLEGRTENDKKRIADLEEYTYELEVGLDSTKHIVELLEKNQEHIQKSIDELCRGLKDFVKEAADARGVRRDIEKLDESVSKWYGMIMNDVREVYGRLGELEWRLEKHRGIRVERGKTG